jgi:hypothetical protein
MNVIKIMGGLGNQLFQYAFGESFMVRGKDISFDISFYARKQKHPREYLLNRYQICQCRFEKNQHVFLDRIRDDHQFHPEYSKLDDIYFDGYWQSLPYFKEILPILRKEFTLKDEYTTNLEFIKYKELIQNDPKSISIHVRRGDYLEQNGWGVLPTRYYYLALKQVKGNFYIFSDDIEFCRKIFREDYFYDTKVTFINMEPALDLELMSLCKTNIIANSTFSYWAAMLNKNESHKVICPAHWLGENTGDESEKHYPKEWIKIYNYDTRN